MKKFATSGSMILIAVLGLLGLTPAVQASPNARLHLSVSGHTLVAGQSLTVRAVSNVVCDLYVTWNGGVRRVHGTRLTATYRAPVVTKPTQVLLRGICVPSGQKPARAPRRPGGGRAGAAAETINVFVPHLVRATVVITVDPVGTVVSAPGHHPHGGGGLPNTGGPPVWLLIAGLAAALLGAVLTRRPARAGVEV